MKKILCLISCLFLLAINKGFTQTDITEMKYCAVAQEQDTGNKLSKVVSNVSGANFISTKAAELAIQKAIRTQLGSGTNVEIYPYTLGSLIQGKFKKMTLDSKSLNLAGLHVSNFSAATLCDYNQVGVKDNNLLFKENFVMKFSGKITQKDLKETMSSSQYLALVESVKVNILGQTLFKMSSMDIGIKDNKLVITSKVMSPVMWGMDAKTITATSGLSVENGKIKYTNLTVMNNKSSKHLNSLLSLINLVNPFTFEIKLSKNTTGYTSVKNVIIKDNEIQMDGILYAPKNN